MFVFDLTDTNSILSAIINLVIIQHMNTDAHTPISTGRIGIQLDQCI